MGWLSFGSFRGIAFRVNVTLVLGVLAFGLFRFAPGAWVAFGIAVLAHELGHLAVIGITGNRPGAIDVHALGGSCRSSGRATPLDRAAIAWGGVAGQLVLFGAALTVRTFVGQPESQIGGQLLSALLWPNLVMAGLNLIPLRSLDGAEAWKLPGAIQRRVRAARRARPALFLEAASNRTTQDVLDRACEIVDREARESRARRTAKS